MNTKSIVSLAVAALILLAGAQARAHVHAADLQIVSDDGGHFLAIPHKSFHSGDTFVIKQYLEAVKGKNYRIRLRNNLGVRVGVVVAVDGRNIISGKKSHLARNERMYIIEPYGSAELDGWRTDMSTVHRFYFTDVPDSYAAKTFDDTSAMGVIAVAVFREKPRPAPLAEQNIRQGKAAASAPAPARDAAKEESAGTGFGSETYSPVREVEFEAEANALNKMLVKYEWHETLCRKGITRCQTEGKNRLWDNDGFAPFPPGYGR